MSEQAGKEKLQSSPSYTQERSFWELMGYAALLGVFGAVAGLIFIGVTGLGEVWYGESGLGWFEGNLWWVAVAAAAGLLVGILRKVFHMPEHVAGFIEALKNEEVEPATVAPIVAVSAVSLIGGASLGPESALGSMGGGAGTWLARRRNFNESLSKATTLSGLAGALGGLFSSPLMAVVLVLEIAAPDRKVSGKAFIATVVSSSVSFGLYFAVAGTIFLGIYEVPTYDFENWYLFLAVGLGVLAAFVVLVMGGIMEGAKRLLGPGRIPDLARPVIGGVTFGLIGFALPLSLFTGSEQLATILENVGTLTVGLLVATLLAKMIALAVSSASGFIGGPIFPILFIGGVAGVILNAIFPEIPLGLAFTCMLAAVPGAVVSAPFSMVLLASLLTQVGALQTAPILIAVGTSALTVAAVRFAASRRTTSESDPSGSSEISR